jgi:uncharacterized protein (TIGR03000 family)
MRGQRAYAAAGLLCLAVAGVGRAGGIGNAMYYGPYTGGEPYSYAEAYGYMLPFTSAGFSGPWTYPHDWTGYPYRHWAFPACGTKGYPKYVPYADDLCAYPPGPPAPAAVVVQVPADAELWFDGARTAQTGPNRTFESPPLPGGKIYHYVVRARWTENGKAVEQIRMVSVQAGQQARLSFSEP